MRPQRAGAGRSERSATRGDGEGFEVPSDEYLIRQRGDLACGEVTGACRRGDPGGGPPLPQAVRAERAPQGDEAQGLLREAQRASPPRGTQATPQGPAASDLPGVSIRPETRRAGGVGPLSGRE